MKGENIYFSKKIVIKIIKYVHIAHQYFKPFLQIQINPGRLPKSLGTDTLRIIDTSDPCYSLKHDVRILEWNDFSNSEISPFVLGLLANSQQNPTRYIDVTLKQ